MVICLLLFFTYLLSVTGNLLIITLTLLDSHLKTPIYFFLRNFSFLEISFTTVCIPKFLVSMATGDKTISYNNCAAQLFFTILLGATEFCLLAAMPYEYSRLISFRVDRLDLLADQGTLKNLLQQHSLKASVLWHSAFFMIQHSHPYMTTGKIVALTIWIFVSKVMSLSRFLIAFLPRSKCLNLMAALTFHSDFGAQENKVCYCFHFFPNCLLWSDGPQCHNLSYLNVEF